MKEEDEEKRESFEDLCKRKATCFEMAWNGYICLYDKDQEKCKCQSCLAIYLYEQQRGKEF